MRPVKKERNGTTIHKDGTISFFNSISGDWERAPSARRQEVMRLERTVQKSSGKRYANEAEKICEQHYEKMGWA